MPALEQRENFPRELSSSFTRERKGERGNRRRRKRGTEDEETKERRRNTDRGRRRKKATRVGERDKKKKRNIPRERSEKEERAGKKLERERGEEGNIPREREERAGRETRDRERTKERSLLPATFTCDEKQLTERERERKGERGRRRKARPTKKKRRKNTKTHKRTRKTERKKERNRKTVPLQAHSKSIIGNSTSPHLTYSPALPLSFYLSLFLSVLLSSLSLFPIFFFPSCSIARLSLSLVKKKAGRSTESPALYILTARSARGGWQSNAAFCHVSPSPSRRFPPSHSFVLLRPSQCQCTSTSFSKKKNLSLGWESNQGLLFFRRDRPHLTNPCPLPSPASMVVVALEERKERDAAHPMSLSLSS